MKGKSPQKPKERGIIVKRLTDEEAMLAVNIMIALGALNNVLPSIRNFSIYRNQIKMHCEALRKQIEVSMLNEGISLMDADEQTFCGLVDMYEQMITNLFSIRPDHWQLVPYIIKWVNDPKCLQHLQLKAMAIEQDVADSKLNAK